MYWEESINISHLHRFYSDGKINVVQLAKGLVGRLKTTRYYAVADPDFMDIIMELNSIDEFGTHEDYRIALDYLYDFGDRGGRLWIETDKPTSKEDVEDDNRATKIDVKMFDDYEKNIGKDSEQSVLKGPYYNSSFTKATPAINASSSSSCATPTSRYNRKRHPRYLSDYEFEQRLKAKGIDPKILPKDISNYIKDADDQYQAWIMDRWIDNAGKVINPKKAPRERTGKRIVVR